MLIILCVFFSAFPNDVYILTLESQQQIAFTVPDLKNVREARIGENITLLDGK